MARIEEGMKMNNLPKFERLVLILSSLTLFTPVLGNDLSTSFEFSDTSGQFILGTSPNTVTFTNGEAKTIGVLSLYHTGSRSWMIDNGKTGTITFETPAAELTLFFRDQGLAVQSVLTLFDTDNQVIRTFNGTSANWTEVNLSMEADGIPAIGSITLQNPGVTGYAVIDDFSFCAAQQLTETLFLTHFGSGGGLQSDVVGFNPNSTASATGEVNFFDQDGTPLDSSGFLPGGNSFMLSPLGSATLSTTGAGSTVITGSATVASDTPISAVIRFDITGVGVAGVEASQVVTSSIAPVRRTGALSSGVAFRNTGTSTIQVTLELKDESGKVVSNGTETRTLAGNARIAEFIETLFPNAQTTNFTGTICVTAQSGQISVIALELDAANNVFTTLPVSAVN